MSFTFSAAAKARPATKGRRPSAMSATAASVSTAQALSVLPWWPVMTIETRLVETGRRSPCMELAPVLLREREDEPQPEHVGGERQQLEGDAERDDGVVRDPDRRSAPQPHERRVVELAVPLVLGEHSPVAICRPNLSHVKISLLPDVTSTSTTRSITPSTTRLLRSLPTSTPGPALRRTSAPGVMGDSPAAMIWLMTTSARRIQRALPWVANPRRDAAASSCARVAPAGAQDAGEISSARES